MRPRRVRLLVSFLLGLCLTAASLPAQTPRVVHDQQLPGYWPIWFDLGQRSEYGSKYSGGLGTYTAKHRPLVIHSPEANKTFFVYGGATGMNQRYLLAMAGAYDHATGTLTRPTLVHDKQGVNDPHDNPSLALDEEGYLWVFISGRGRHRPGFLYRSKEPYSTEAFERIDEWEFTYPQPVYHPERGFLLLFTKYTHGRELYWSTSPDGVAWSEDQKLAGMGGHYQMTEMRPDGRVITAFNYHPGAVVDRRTNLYFLQTDDFGKTWTTIEGSPVATPLTETDSPALIRDYQGEGLRVYLKDITFDRAGRPVLLYITSRDHRPGPGGNPRTWTIAHWQGDRWAFREVTTSTHNYDMGSLYIEADGVWRLIAPTEPGPQRWGTGGEVAVWVSKDQGRTWAKTRAVTRNSPLNHAYVRRPVDAHPDFYAFWADGNPDGLSPSRLYFCNRAGDQVWMLPTFMPGPAAPPVALIQRQPSQNAE